ncbi:MAG TPA: hypothetical protein VET24_00470 [Actinomycetota bacterium]|nr:hypothetical protein [Actinomycetota bacterium]
MHPLTRRTFLTTGGAAAMAFVTLKTGIAHVAKTGSTAIQGSGVNGSAARLGSAATPFTRSAFQPHVDTPFRLQTGARAVDLQLVSVQQLSQRTAKGAALKGTQFSLLFSGPTPAFGQETYAMEHAVLGHFALFIVPVGKPNGSVQTYQAIINNTSL